MILITEKVNNNQCVSSYDYWHIEFKKINIITQSKVARYIIWRIINVIIKKYIVNEHTLIIRDDIMKFLQTFVQNLF